jgi:hypothetical protein
VITGTTAARGIQQRVRPAADAPGEFRWVITDTTAARGIQQRVRPAASVPRIHARHQPQLRGDECAWCVQRDPRNLPYARSHQLRDCVWPTATGDIAGCPLCNTVEHHCDDCPTRQNMSVEERWRQDFDVLVRGRGGLPPFRSAVP